MDNKEQLPGPLPDTDLDRWLTQLHEWREKELSYIGYDGSLYTEAALSWTQRNFVQPQMMAEERYFYDPIAGTYTVDRYLDDLEQRYGGIDSVLIWPVYPNIGVDNRNQLDLLRDMPGGLPALREMINDFHRRGVKVFFPVMAWDIGTRDEGRPLWEAFLDLLVEIGADGLNGDTYYGVPRAFLTAAQKRQYPLAIEPENYMSSEEMLAYNNLSWGYWDYPFIPAVSKYKWLESRHMVNVCNRWGRDRLDELQAAFFNGVGYESWENIWGIWNQLTPRAGEALRRMAHLERSFAEYLVSPDWQPHFPTMQSGCFASRFSLGSQSLFTLVNRNEYNLSGPQLRLDQPSKDTVYYDLWRGVQLEPEIGQGKVLLSFELEARGFGAVLAVEAASNTGHSELSQFLDQRRVLTQKPLNQFSHDWQFLPQRLVEITPTAPVSSPPPDMILIPGGEFDFQVRGIEIEGDNAVGVDVQYPWEDAPRRHHRQRLNLRPFFIDRYPVTNAQFKIFLTESHYWPSQDHNFLRDWQNGTCLPGWENKPVSWVSLEDARAYAEWAGKRLPHEWEWHYAAQGQDGRRYPWGDEWDERYVPTPERGRAMRAPTAVEAYPEGSSPFGVMDLVGNVWQWTDEYEDEHTRAAILRGGSYYLPQGSHWYFPHSYRLDEHGKYLLMSAAKDRAATIGFRCVVDYIDE